MANPKIEILKLANQKLLSVGANLQKLIEEQEAQESPIGFDDADIETISDSADELEIVAGMISNLL